MTLVTRRHESGLLLAETGGEEAGLSRALRRMDDRLRLLPPAMIYPGTPTGFWRVVRFLTEDKPAAPVLTWMDRDGNPLQLSSGILEEVQRHRLDARNTGPTADERNAALEAAVKKERSELMEALQDEYRPYLDRGRVGVSMAGLRKKPYWQRRWRGGED